MYQVATLLEWCEIRCALPSFYCGQALNITMTSYLDKLEVEHVEMLYLKCKTF